jgi:hypothetical protein
VVAGDLARELGRRGTLVPPQRSAAAAVAVDPGARAWRRRNCQRLVRELGAIAGVRELGHGPGEVIGCQRCEGRGK